MCGSHIAYFPSRNFAQLVEEHALGNLAAVIWRDMHSTCCARHLVFITSHVVMPHNMLTCSWEITARFTCVCASRKDKRFGTPKGNPSLEDHITAAVRGALKSTGTCKPRHENSCLSMSQARWPDAAWLAHFELGVSATHLS